MSVHDVAVTGFDEEAGVFEQTRPVSPVFHGFDAVPALTEWHESSRVDAYWSERR